MGITEQLSIGILGAVIGGTIVILGRKLINYEHKKNMKQDLEQLEYEAEHLRLISTSGSQLNRSAFRSIFALLFLFGIANVIPVFFSLSWFKSLSLYVTLFNLIVWGVFIGLSWHLWKRYDNLRNLDEALEKIEGKRVKLEKKLAVK